MRWKSLRVRPSTARAAVLATMFAAGVGCVLEEDDVLVTHVEDDFDFFTLEQAVLRVDEGATFETAPLPDVDWSREWKRGIQAHIVGVLTITPPWLAPGLDPDTTIVIEPEMAFGTGEHATTRGVLWLLQFGLREGDRVADLGAGSAVLSIAAVKLGASRVAAIELDPDAIANAEANVRANGVADRVTVIQGDAATLLPLVAPVEIVVANILSGEIKRLLPVIAASLAPGGRLIISGVTGDESPWMQSDLEFDGWKLMMAREEEGWWTGMVTRA